MGQHQERLPGAAVVRLKDTHYAVQDPQTGLYFRGLWDSQQPRLDVRDRCTFFNTWLGAAETARERLGGQPHEVVRLDR